MKKCEMGFPYYEALPDGFELAKYEDFFNIKNKPRIGVAFVIKSNVHENRFWANRITEHFPYEGSDMTMFISDGNVYINTIFV